jgi:hypothetical protein
VVELLLTVDSLAVDVGAIQAAQVTKDEGHATLLDRAMLLGHDLVEQLNRIRGVAPQRIVRLELNDLLAFGRCEQEARHRGEQG